MAIMSVKIHGGLSHQALNNNGATIIGSGWRRYATGWMMTVRLSTCTVDVYDQSALPWKDTNREELKDPHKLEKLLSEKLSKKEREIADWRPTQQQGPAIDYTNLFQGFFESLKPAPAPAAPQIDVDAIKADAAIEAAKAAIAAIMPIVQTVQQTTTQTQQKVSDLIAALTQAQNQQTNPQQTAQQQPQNTQQQTAQTQTQQTAAQQSAQQQNTQTNTQTKP